MAGMNMSQALQNIGANLPNIFRQRQQDAIALQATQAKQKKDEEDAAQQAELSRIILDLKKGELEQSNLNRTMGAEGRKAVDEYTTSRNIRNLPISREYDQPLSDLERAKKYNLPKYAPYEPSAKSILSRIDNTDDAAKGLLSGGAVWTQRTNAYKSNPNAIPALGMQIEKLRSSGIIDEANYEQFKRTYEIDPATVDIAINKIVGNPLVAAATVTATTQPKVDQKRALIDPTAATTEANTRTKEVTERDIQAKNPILSEAQGNALQDSYAAVGYLNQMKGALENGNLDWFDQTKVGEFKNPKMNNARNQLVEIIGRKRSGAAISDSEWKNFQNQVLNKNYLLTEQGKAEALNNINDYLDRFYGSGVTTTGNEDWYNVYGSKAKKARELVETKIKDLKPVTSAGTTQGTPDESGFVVGQKKFSKKYGRDLTYKGGGQWE